MGNDNNCQTFCESLINENPRERFRNPGSNLNKRLPQTRYKTFYIENPLGKNNSQLLILYLNS